MVSWCKCDIFLPANLNWNNPGIIEIWSLVFLQQSLKLMSKIGKYDGSSCIAKMLNFGSKTFRMLGFTFGIDLLLSHSHHLWFSKTHCQNLTRKKWWMNYLCYPKILAQNSRFTKKCWISVESPASWSEEKFSSALRRVKISIQHTLLTLISSECWGITQI